MVYFNFEFKTIYTVLYIEKYVEIWTKLDSNLRPRNLGIGNFLLSDEASEPILCHI